MTYTAFGRGAAAALATLLMFGLFLLRDATSPNPHGYWAAIAAGPEGFLYLADDVHHQLLLIVPGGSAPRQATTPNAIYRALAADGPNLLLGTDRGLFVSTDTGAHWRLALAGNATAVAIQGGHALAGLWAKGLWVSDDAGVSWRQATVPVGDTEFEALLPSGYAGTLLGLLHSGDGGYTWTRVSGVPDLVTALDFNGEAQLVDAGDWRGTVWHVDYLGGTVSRGASYPGGVESLAGGVTATTGGLYPKAGGPLDGREVTRLVHTHAGWFAAEARGPIYFSGDGRSWSVAYQG